jgi:hypothetical protein
VLALESIRQSLVPSVKEYLSLVTSLAVSNIKAIRKTKLEQGVLITCFTTLDISLDDSTQQVDSGIISSYSKESKEEDTSEYPKEPPT